MLPTINLLPWRERRREAHRQRFFQLLVLVIVLAGALQFALGRYVEDQVNQQSIRLSFLKQNIATIDNKIKEMQVTQDVHKALLTRLDVVEQLQKQRNKTTDFMNVVPKLIPKGVYIDKFKVKGTDVEVTGFSDSTARLATMLDRFEKSPDLENVEMHSIVHGKTRFGQKFQTFKVSFEIVIHSISSTSQYLFEQGVAPDA
ncbi:PilN domain-containing protein [Vibrio sp. FNV 38]|nr:PilN domain-containing protein [Vibrio sp. FNV 38]